VKLQDEVKMDGWDSLIILDMILETVTGERIDDDDLVRMMRDGQQIRDICPSNGECIVREKGQCPWSDVPAPRCEDCDYFASDCASVRRFSYRALAECQEIVRGSHKLEPGALLLLKGRLKGVRPDMNWFISLHVVVGIKTLSDHTRLSITKCT
jgi:hypothetical protein